MKKVLKDTRFLIFALAWSLIFSLLNYIGFLMEKFESVFFSFKYLYIFLGLFIIAFCLFFCIYLILKKIATLKYRKNKSKLDSVKGFFVGAISLFVLWIPSFLAVYPGLFVYDANIQYETILNHAVTTHHPIIHTYLIGLTIRCGELLLGSINKGVVIYCLVQMIILATLISFSLSYFIKWGHSKLWLFSIVWFSVFPPLVLHVFAVTKDTIFSTFCLAFTVCTIELLRNNELGTKHKFNFIMWCVTLFFCIIFRNNALYSFCFFCAMLLVFINKKQRVITLLGIVFVFLLFAIYSGPVTKLVTVDGINKQELLSVPSQQIVRTYKTEIDNLTDDEKAIVLELFDDIAIDYYNPRIADATKRHFNENVFKENPSKYIKFYIKLGLEYPLDYIDSFCMNTYGFWYPYASLVLFLDGKMGYGVVDCYQPAVLNSKIPLLLRFYKLFENSSIVQGNSPIVLMFAPATYFWTMILCAMFGLYQRKKYVWLPLVNLIILWCTFLLGPVVLVRYCLYLFMLLPVEVVLLLPDNHVDCKYLEE